MERLTYMPFSVFVGMWFFVFCGLGYNLFVHPVPFSWLWELIPAGLLTWFFFEYVMHRFLFHMKFHSAWGQRFVFIIHGNHHDFPQDRYRNLMPGIVSLPLAAGFEFLFCQLMGYNAGRLFFVGFVIGYVLYDGLHFAMHQRRFSNRLLRHIQIHHLRHHYHASNANYAVTAIMLDRLFASQCGRKEP